MDLPSNDDDKKNITSFSEAMNKELSEDEKIKNLTEDMDEIIAFADGESKIQLVHSVTNLGGTRSRPKNKIVGIIGMGNQGIFVELDANTMVSDLTFNAPSLEAYKGCESNKEFESLIPDGGGSFEGSAAFIMAPFLRMAVLQAEMNDPLELIPIVIHAAEEFD